MIFSYNWLQSFFNKTLPKPEKLAEVLTMHSFEAKVEKEVQSSGGKKDIILDIDVLPNRAHDCRSHLGIAKEISVLLNIPLEFPHINSKSSGIGVSDKSQEEVKDVMELEVADSVLCRRYIAGVMKDVKVGESPQWIKERLLVVGQKPINNIVDCANYVMLEMGQPLHAFDFDKIGSTNHKSQFPKIIVRKAKKGERITTLDNKNLELDESVLVIADNKEPLAIAGIKGGKRAEINLKTKNIIVESANFEPVNIRLTSQKIGLRTDASVDFENEISPFLAEIAINRLMFLIQETGGGKIISGKIDFPRPHSLRESVAGGYSQKTISPRIVFKTSDVSKLLGVSISEKEILSILEKLNFSVKKSKGALIVAGPAERLDLNIKEDVIEEIARIHGYEKIPAKIPEGPLAPARRNDSYFYNNIIRDLMVGMGFSEVYNYSFSKTGEVEIQNPIAIDKKFLRSNLLDGLKDNVEQNFKYFDEVKVFEIGKIFRSLKTGKKDISGVVEKNKLAGVIARKNARAGKESFYEIKGVMESALSGMGISDYWFDDSPETPEVKAEQPMAMAEIKIGNEGVGYIDKDSFELDLDKLVNFINEEIEFRPISKYPAVMRDIAILVPIETRVIEVIDVIENMAGELLIDSDLFDIYEGEELGESRKSFAFHLIFQSSEKTLSDKEVNVMMDKIIKALENNQEWEIRK